MSNETALEQRLTDLEQVVAVLQRQVNAQQNVGYQLQPQGKQPQNWLEKLIGSISDEAAFFRGGRVWQGISSGLRIEDWTI
jgi:hypothetical protein